MKTGLILLYHSIAERSVDPWHLCVTPQHFREQLSVLCKLTRPIRLADWQEDADHNDQAAPVTVLTFDDGYADNLTAAAALLNRFAVPATMFVVPPSSTPHEFWWDELDRLLLTSNSLPKTLLADVPEFCFEWDLGVWADYNAEAFAQHRQWTAWQPPPTSRHRVYAQLWQRLRCADEPTRERVLNDLFEQCGLRRETRPSQRRLTNAELHALAATPGIEVGAHTLTHPSLATLTRAEQLAEIFGSKEQIEAITDRQAGSFSYPFGKQSDYSSETKRLVREAGFERACSGVAHDVPANDPYELPRHHVPDLGAAEFKTWLVDILNVHPDAT